MVDGILGPAGDRDLRQWRPRRRNVCPVPLNRYGFLAHALRPLGALIDPAADRRDLCFVELATHRHARLVANARDAPVERTLDGFSGHDDGTGTSSGERCLFPVQPEPRHLQLRTMAAV